MANVALLTESRQLDRYQLIGEIASGGMASVFLARLAGVGGFQRFVAIKRLHPHLAKEREFVDMFLDEARLAASIHHRNVVPILEIGTSDHGYYLVMEYIEGVTLARLMTQAAALREPVPRPVLLRIIVDTLSGLHAAHELGDDHGAPLGVVHRDCSPQNILIGLDGTTRITDFGIARASARLHNTREGAMKGKLAYMAPEQTQGDDFDRRADLFSVAVVLWEVLAERRLFRSKTEAQTLKRLLHDPIPRLSELRPDISPALAAVCAMALERDPTLRFQTAAEMADALEAAAKVASKAAEPVATERTVEALMKARYGGDVENQREEVRSWLQATPTHVGPRPRSTDPGWMAPPSDPGESDELTTSSAPPEERTITSDKAPNSASGLGSSRGLSSAASGSWASGSRSSGPPQTHRSWPVRSSTSAPAVALPGPAATAADETAAAESEDTHIYEPSSTTGVTAGSEEWVQAPTGRAQVARRPRGGMWAAVALLFGALALALAVALWMRNKAEAAGDTRPASSRGEPQRETGAEPATSAPDPRSTAPLNQPDPSTAPVAQDSVATPAGPRPYVRPNPGVSTPPSAPAPAPISTPEPQPAPAPPPGPKDPDGDDINPYR